MCGKLLEQDIDKFVGKFVKVVDSRGLTDSGTLFKVNDGRVTVKGKLRYFAVDGYLLCHGKNPISAYDSTLYLKSQIRDIKSYKHSEVENVKH